MKKIQNKTLELNTRNLAKLDEVNEIMKNLQDISKVRLSVCSIFLSMLRLFEKDKDKIVLTNKLPRISNQKKIIRKVFLSRLTDECYTYFLFYLRAIKSVYRLNSQFDAYYFIVDRYAKIVENLIIKNRFDVILTATAFSDFKKNISLDDDNFKKIDELKHIEDPIEKKEKKITFNKDGSIRKNSKYLPKQDLM